MIDGYGPIGRNLKRDAVKTLLANNIGIGKFIGEDDYNESFYDFMKESFSKALDQMISNALDIKSRTNGFEIKEPGFFYVDIDESGLKISVESKNLYMINFNHFGFIMKNIFQESYINDYSVLQDKLVLSRDSIDEFNFLFKELYFLVKKEISKKVGINVDEIDLLLFLPDIITWTITVSTGSLIYAIVQELFTYVDGIIFKTATGSRNSLVEKAAQVYGTNVKFLQSFKGLTPYQDVVVKLLPFLKEKYTGDLGEFFVKVKGLGETLHNCLIDPTEKPLNKKQNEIFIIDTTVKKFVEEYFDFIELNNTLPEELKTLKEELQQYKSVVSLGIIDNKVDENNYDSNPITLEILRLESQIENFEINVFGHDISSFVKFLVTKIELKDLPIDYHKYLKDTVKDKRDIEETVKNFDRIFRERIIGQDQVINSIWNILKRWYIGLRSQKPVGSFLFCGPTGVGKTETAKLLADISFGNLITLDMSEYQTEIDATKIIGVAPGYSGYDQGAGILDKIAANPRSIILFDEIEKAHYKIFDLLLQVLDEGRLTDHKGNTVSFKECFVICTTNAHYTEIEHLGDNARSKMIEILCNTFRKEFLARFDDVLKYNHLSNETMEKIFDKKVDTEILEVSKTANLEIIVIEDENYFKKKSDIINFLDNSLGARELQRIITKDIISEIINYVAEMDDSREKVVFYFDTEGKLKVSNQEVDND